MPEHVFDDDLERTARARELLEYGIRIRHGGRD
jgi:hypothetical protein